MPPFQGHSSLQAPPSFPQRAMVAINVGGTLFQTSAATLQRADPGSILCKTLSFKNSETLFFDRDPELFSLLLSLLRSKTHFLPSNNTIFSPHQILSEAAYYGVTAAVKSALSPPPFDALNAVKKSVLLPSGLDGVNSLSADGDGNLIFSHGSKISAFDSTLQKKSTVLTHFNCIDSLTAVSPSIAVAGAVDFPGLHVYDVQRKTHVAAVHWVSSSPELRLHAPTVISTAVCPSSRLIFASFESGRKNAHTILLIDGKSFCPVGEMGTEICSAVNSDPPATKLEWINTHNLLLSSSVSSGPFGQRGVLKLWDIRSQKAVWQFRESNPAPGGKSDPSSYSDCFSDVAVGKDFGAVFKVGVRDGELFMADLRNLNVGNPWIFVGDSNPAPGGGGCGAQKRVLGYGKQVLVSSGGELEAWCDVGSMEGNVLRRSVVGPDEGGRITGMVAGGNRVFVARKGLQGVEVWESPRSY